MQSLEQQAVNAIRILSADAIEKAKSGHPGLPLGTAPAAYELFAHHLKHNPKDPEWADRDRFILSGGHGSMLLYSLFHLFGYSDLSLDELKQFRQLGSRTAGHPEYHHPVGVEATTGPLGAGMGMAVGMAIAERHLAEEFNREGFPVVDHYTYALGGDGCMMEGISHEAFSLAGTLKLSKLIIIYDSNRITIEGSTDIAFTEDVQKRMEAYGFGLFDVPDGNDINAIAAAIEAAKADTERPSFITIHTEIGYGCPKKQGTAAAHGEPLGEDNVRELKEFLEWPSQEPFYVPEEVYAHYRALTESLVPAEEEWNAMFRRYRETYPDLAEKWDLYHDRDRIKELIDQDQFWQVSEKADATRNHSGAAINRIKDILPQFIGGSADLGTSNRTVMNGESDFSAENYGGRNMHFGIREIAMTAVGNGMALHGGLIPYVATFFVFSDYTKPMARLSALMGVPLIYVFSHDSIGVGEDGPTHEPIEQAAMWRSLPNFHLFRPADAMETNAAWFSALTSDCTPTALALTRQTVPVLEHTSREALRGGYILEDADKEVADAIVIASGSEVSLAVEAKKLLKEEGIDIRVVSMPCLDIFLEQDEAYREKVLPKSIRKRVAVEALSGFGWGEIVGLDGKVIAMPGYGASAPYSVLFPYYGFTKEHVAETVRELVNE